MFLLTVAFISVPGMLIPKPLLLLWYSRRKPKSRKRRGGFRTIEAANNPNNLVIDTELQEVATATVAEVASPKDGSHSNNPQEPEVEVLDEEEGDELEEDGGVHSEHGEHGGVRCCVCVCLQGASFVR